MNLQRCLTDADMGRLWEGDMPTTERSNIELHLETCQHCRERWERISVGTRCLEAAFKTHGKSPPQKTCPSTDLLVGFLSDMLDEEEKRLVETHLSACEPCREVVSSARHWDQDYEWEDDQWWARFIGRQVLGLIAQVPDQVEELLSVVKADDVPIETPAEAISLSGLQPLKQAEQRLAAATGEGFSRQTLRQNQPPFEFQLVKFGDEVRITIHTLEKDSPYNDCLAKLAFYEGGVCKLSRVVLVDNGEGRCILDPPEVCTLRPDKEQLKLKLSPIKTLEEFANAGSEAYLPILKKLLRHNHSKIRRGTVQVLARLGGQEAVSLLKSQLDDKDETVRTEARKALIVLAGKAE